MIFYVYIFCLNIISVVSYLKQTWNFSHYYFSLQCHKNLFYKLLVDKYANTLEYLRAGAALANIKAIYLIVYIDIICKQMINMKKRVWAW